MTAENEKCEKKSISEENHTKAENINNFPQRKENVQPRRWYEKILFYEKNEQVLKTKCEMNVAKCVKESPIVKLMLNALKSSGCEFDIARHISCDLCEETVSGGYDAELNQVIICYNMCTNQNYVLSTLTHELIHMFDYCRNKLDYNNLDHLACTEIRAANQCHCSFLGAMYRGTASPFHIKQAHRDCVTDKAIRSVLAVKEVSKDDATAAVMRVFDRCYNDLEPIGRRIRRKSNDMRKAYFEGSYYGYSD
ncbi:PREDICTED: mitochondrial inner membrane protease ATP23 homolog [Eufriesea mexicana]|uniref:mitochondrial inner membrane protease ATP23 homolog n=1 Tax=Eufriesea mexicana TaxID=516756 RepID=UPI00083C07AB|nr:PREDICTED: mitochondrial inner membrane protease ATP23 homolog [Eufriesea mexicana]